MVSVRRVAPLLLLVMAIPALAAQPNQTSRPPKNLHLVGDHWTPYNPPDPSTYPPGAKTHTIVAGNTLWDLAQQYYGSAYLWPQLWESNTWITDAHWIYPGDVLLIEGETAAQAAAGAAEGTGAGSEATGSAGSTTLGGGSTPTGGAQGIELGQVAQITPAARTPIPLGSDYDIYCYGYIGDPSEPMPNIIASFEDTEMRWIPGAAQQEISGSNGDLVFIDGDASTGLVSGETYMIVDKGPIITHPRTGEVLGRQWDYRGTLRVLCTQSGQSRGMIMNACKEIEIGMRLKPMPQIPIPLARVPDMPGFCDPPSGGTMGFIVNSLGWELSLGEGNLVQINLGRNDQIQPGDFLTVFRESPQPGQPRQILGEIGILTTENTTSTARIVMMRRTMLIGDRVELVAR